MDRRNFLAFLPSLSAVPFLGKEIVKDDSGIHIVKPEPMVKAQKSIKFDDIFNCEVRIYIKGEYVGNAYMESMTIDNRLSMVNDLVSFPPEIKAEIVIDHKILFPTIR